MAHYAWINSDNIVINVTVGVHEYITHSDNGTPVGGSTEAWEAFYTTAINQEGVYTKRTSYNATNGYRKQYAGIGFSYLADADVFVAPQPFASWTLDNNHDWQPPTPMPVTGHHRWNEAELAWVAI